MSLIRSLLFVPGDRPDRIEKALISGADAVILDLEDSVLPEAKAKAREVVAALLRERLRKAGPACWVRINPLGTEFCAADIAALAVTAPGTLLQPKVNGCVDVLTLAARLDAAGMPPETGICPVATETPASLFALGTYADAGPRLSALTWGAEDLATALGSLSTSSPVHSAWPPRPLPACQPSKQSPPISATNGWWSAKHSAPCRKDSRA
jgi:citrate lyase subunit beta / citryl-CoA lyase